MSNRHLPAGQSIHQGGPGGVPGADMGGAPGGGPRRRQPQYVPQYHQQQQQQHMGPMYPNYVPYAPQGYYGMPPQFQNGGMPSPGYMPYQNYARSPPSMHQYVPMVGVSVPPNYPRPAQHSPSLSTPYQPPPAPPPIPPQTPSSTHSSQMLPPPTPPTPQIIEQPVPAPPAAAVAAPQLDSSPIVERKSFRPPVCCAIASYQAVLMCADHVNSCLGYRDPTQASLPEHHGHDDGESRSTRTVQQFLCLPNSMARPQIRLHQLPSRPLMWPAVVSPKSRRPIPSQPDLP